MEPIHRSVKFFSSHIGKGVDAAASKMKPRKPAEEGGKASAESRWSKREAELLQRVAGAELAEAAWKAKQAAWDRRTEEWRQTTPGKLEAKRNEAESKVQVLIRGLDDYRKLTEMLQAMVDDTARTLMKRNDELAEKNDELAVRKLQLQDRTAKLEALEASLSRFREDISDVLPAAADQHDQQQPEQNLPVGNNDDVVAVVPPAAPVPAPAPADAGPTDWPAFLAAVHVSARRQADERRDLETARQDAAMARNQATRQAADLQRTSARLRTDLALRDDMIVHLEQRLAGLAVERADAERREKEREKEVEREAERRKGRGITGRAERLATPGEPATTTTRANRPWNFGLMAARSMGVMNPRRGNSS